MGEGRPQLFSPPHTQHSLRAADNSVMPARRTDPQLLDHARSLRRNATEAERILWLHLRARRLAGFKFRRQHPIGVYILDFYCARARLAVEIDGDQHGTDAQRELDETRSAFLHTQGIRVLRFSNLEVLAEAHAVLEMILATLQGR